MKKSLLTLAAAALVAASAPAVTVTWTGATDSNWDTTTDNWSGGSPSSTDFVDGDAVTFGSATNRIITVASAYNVGLMTFSGINGAYTFSGATLTLTGGITNSNTSGSRDVTIGNNIVVSGVQTWTSANDSDSRTLLNGQISGSGNITATGYAGATIASAGNRQATFRFTPASGDNSAYTGAFTIDGGSVMFNTSSAFFTGASAVNVRNNAQALFNYAVTDTNLAKLVVNSPGAAIVPTGGSATGGNVLIWGNSGTASGLNIGAKMANTGGTFVLDNYDSTFAAISNRLGDSQAVAINNFVLTFLGYSDNTAANKAAETMGAITYEGASRFAVAPRSSTSSKLAVLADSLALASGSGKTGTLTISNTNWSADNGLFLATAPTLDANNMMSPGIVLTTSASGASFATAALGGSATYASRYQVTNFTGYTTYTNPATFAPASATEAARILFNASSTNAAMAAPQTVNALEIDNTGATVRRDLDLGGYKLTITGGGLLLDRVANFEIRITGAAAGSELAFGATEGFIHTTGASSYIEAPISGSKGITKSGSGTLHLTGTNTFTGGIRVNEGSLRLGNGNHINGQVVTVGAFGTYNARGTATNNVMGGLQGSGIVVIASGDGDQNQRINVASDKTYTFDGALTNGGATLSLTKLGDGTQVFNGYRAGGTTGGSSAGTTTVSAGTLIVSGNWSLTNGTVTIASGGSLILGNDGATGSLSGLSTIVNDGSLTFNRTNTVAQGIDFSTAAITGTGNLTQNGTGTLILNAANTYSGNTTINAGALRLAVANDRLPTGTAVTLANVSGAVLDLNGFSQTIGSLAGGGATGGNVTLGSGTLTVGNATSTGFGGVISGTGGLTKLGAGTLSLNGANTYTGVTSVNVGTLLFLKQNSLYNGDTGNWTLANITVSSGATFAVSAGNTTGGNAPGNFTDSNITTLLALGSATNGFANGSILGIDTTYATAGNFTYGSAIANPNGGANALGLTKFGTGNLIVTAANTYNGTTRIESGSLILGNNGTTGSLNATGTIVNNGTLVFDRSNDIAQGTDFTSAAITGTGGIRQTGGGGTTLNVANTFSGNTTVEEGNLTAFGDDALQNTGNVVITGGTLLLSRSTNGSSTIVNDSANFVLGNATGGGTLKLGGNITEQVGTLTLSGSSTIDLNALGTIRFTASAGIPWAEGAELSIRNWVDSATSGIFVGNVSDSTSLTNDQLAQIRGYDPDGEDLGLANWGANGELTFTPIPEPGTVAVFLLLGLFVFWRERRVLGPLLFRTRPALGR
jgi:fibronectin-binding autotransporter adhesin